MKSESCSVKSCWLDSLQPHGLYNPWNSPGQNTGVGNCSLLQGIFPTQGLNPAMSPALLVDSLPAEPSGKPKNTGVDSLSLLQRVFPTQELNQGFLHCRQIHYQLSYQGSPKKKMYWSLTSIENIKQITDILLDGVSQSEHITDGPRI